MDALKSIFIWLTGVIMIVVFFPVTFLIWIFTLPFDKNRKVIHRLLNRQKQNPCRTYSYMKLIIEEKGECIR